MTGGGIWQRRVSRLWRRRAMALGAVLLLCWALLPRTPASMHHAHHFPTIRPDVLAHYLADLSNQALLYPHPESWAIETEWSNVTSWRYEVSYSCGVRSVGRVAVSAHAHVSDIPRHGVARKHRVVALDEHCARLFPLLPWPVFCEETETDVLIEGEKDGEGSHLTENAVARCSPFAALLTQCAGAAELVARHQLRLRALSAALV